MLLVLATLAVDGQFILIYIATFAVLSVLRLQALNSHAYDLGI